MLAILLLLYFVLGHHTHTGGDIVLSVVCASVYKRCLTLNRLLSLLLLLLLFIWFVSLISWDPSAG